MAENTLDVSNRHIDNLIKYVLDTKPYHVKLSEVVEEFIFEDAMSVAVSDALDSMTVVGLDYKKASSNPALNIWQKAPIRPESSLSAERLIVSDGSRRVFATPQVLINKFFVESSQEVHFATDDPTEIPGLNTVVISPRKFCGSGVPRVAVNDIKYTEGVDYDLSLGAFSFKAGAGEWMQHNIAAENVEFDKDGNGFLSTAEQLAETNYIANLPDPINGELAYEDVIRVFGRITDIVGDGAATDFEEWTLEWNDADQKLDVIGSHSGLIGQAEYGVAFSHALISFLFTHAPDEADELPPMTVGDKFVLTPSAKISVHPTAAQETWTLIKINPKAIVSDPVFTGPAGPRPWLTVFSRGLDSTPATTFTLTFTGDETFDLSSSTSLSGYPKTGLKIDKAFKDEFVHLRVNRTTRVFQAGDTFTFEVAAQQYHYLVYGSVSGWQQPATIGEWYWNGKIGFKIPRLEYFIYVNDDVENVFTQFFLPHHNPGTWMQPSKYEIVFHDPADSEVTATVFNNITGYSSGLRCGEPWSDGNCSWTIDGTFSPGDKLTVLLAPSGTYSYYGGYAEAPYDTTLYDVGTAVVTQPINILQEYFPLYHSYGSVIIPSLQPDDIVVINKTERDHVRLRIGAPPDLQENGLGYNLGQSLGGVNVDPSQIVLNPILADASGWVPLSFSYFDEDGDPSYFGDYVSRIDAYLASAPQTKVFEIRQPAGELAVLEFDEDFFDEYLPSGTNFWLKFHQNSSHAQTINVKVTEHIDIKLTRWDVGVG